MQAERRVPPEVPGGRLTGSIRDLLRDQLGTYTAALRHGDVVTMRVGPPRLGTSSCLVFHPDGVQHVLASAARTYLKKDPVYTELRLWFGDGLLTDEGPRWQARRRTVQPLFTARQVAAFDAPMLAEVQALLQRWDTHARTGEPVDLHADMTALTLYVVSRVLLGGEADETLESIAATYPVLNRHVLRRIASLVRLPHQVPLPGNVRAHAAKARLFGSAREVVRRRTARRDGRREGPVSPPGGDLLDRLLAARDPETGAGLSEEELVSQVVTFLLAGQETSAIALTAALHLLAQHPEAQERLHDEAAAVLAGRAPQAADVPQLPLAAHVFYEALRLYPPAWASARRAETDDAVCGYRVDEGTMVVISQWVTQRDPRWWEEPERFLPGRWVGDQSAERHRYAWFPFGGGPRACIGRHFALQEAVLVLSAIVQRFRLSPVTPALNVQAGVTLQPREAVLAGVEARGL